MGIWDAITGSAEEAAVVFGEAAVLAVQKQQLQVTSQDFFTCNVDHIQVSAKRLEDATPGLVKNIHVKDASGSNQGVQGIGRSSEVICQPSNCAPSRLSSYFTPSAMASQQLQVTSQDFFTCNEDHVQVSAKSLEGASPRQLKYIHSYSVKDASGSHEGSVISSGAVNRPSHCAPCALSFYNTPSPTASQVRYDHLFLFPFLEALTSYFPPSFGEGGGWEG